MILITETKALPNVGILERGTMYEFDETLETELVRQGIAEPILVSPRDGNIAISPDMMDIKGADIPHVDEV